jgi:diguanylate cyclase (GGDEF)-like protein
LRGATFIGVATVIAAAFGIWQFDRTAQSIRDMTHQLAIKTLSEGVAVAVQGDVITRDYGSLEARLMQTMADIRVLSIMVTDQDGKVLSQVKRDLESGQPKPIYSPTPIELIPQSFSPHGGVTARSLQLAAGLPIGSLRIEMIGGAAHEALFVLRSRVNTILFAACAILLLSLLVVMQRVKALIRREEDVLHGRNQVLEVAAYHDSLTGLPNRTLLFDRMAQAIAFSDRQHKTMAVCYMDLDKFGDVNTNYGHAVGDRVLKTVAQRLEYCVRANDTVARLGGDEFVVLLTSIEDRVELDLILHRIQAEFERPIELSPGDTVIVGISIGVTIYPTDYASPFELIEHADYAMYQAKKLGTNKIFIRS